MTDDQEWIPAGEALRLLKDTYGIQAPSTICKRAHAGLLRARAVKIFMDNKPQVKQEIPKEFWWAKGGASLKQNWKAGDFGTWINQTLHIEAFGVEFDKTGIEALLPRPSGNVPNATVKEYSNRVFIVHGRDEGPREAVATLLRNLGLDPII